MQHFKDVKFIGNPKNNTSICFSCDDIYFVKYGQFTLKTCIAIKQRAHCHIINPSAESKEIVNTFNDNDISFSFEILETANFNNYQILSYYFCSRFFIANELFNNFDVQKLWITDTDVWFNEPIDDPENKKLVVAYNPAATNLWKKSTGSIMFVHRDRSIFLKQVINEFQTRYNSTDFNKITPSLSKIARSNIYGLDQVSVSSVIEKFYLNDYYFSPTLSIIPNLKGKHKEGVKVWIPLGKSKDCVRENGFRDIKL